MIKTYSELIKLPTLLERYEYLKLGGGVAEKTFGFERYLNQDFYRSNEWRNLRNHIIVRDNGCDLGVEGCDIYGKIIIHHMNPVSVQDIVHSSDILLDPEFLICVSHDMHNAIHYGDESLIKGRYKLIERTQNDTCPWRKCT